MKNYRASIDSIESFSTKDGPGIRSVVFFNGCKLRCLFCHNPETWIRKDDNISVDELYDKLIKFKEYYGKDGGVTFSGGEPLLHSDFIIELSKKLKKENISLALDTAGVGNGNYEEILSYMDLIILDIKDYRKDNYKFITGRNIDDFNVFLNCVQKLDKPILIRQVIIPGINDNEDYILGLKSFLKDIKNIVKIELLPYHSMAIEKYEKLNIEYKLKNVKDMDKTLCDKLEDILKK